MQNALVSWAERQEMRHFVALAKAKPAINLHKPHFEGTGQMCDCIICENERRERNVEFANNAARKAAKAEPQLKLSEVRTKFIDYFTNPQKYIDMTKGDYSKNVVTFPIKSMQEVTGLSKLGSGVYADVYGVNNKLVLKVLKDEDSGYERFLNAIETSKAKGNPHLPKVYYKGRWGGKRVFVLERLQPYSLTPNGGQLCAWFRETIRTQVRNTNPYITTSFATPEIAFIAEFMYKHDLGNDLHNENLMFRGDVPVITDPSSY